jgi:hypothetical protein
MQKIHPEILEMIDSGAPKIDALIGKNHLAELVKLSERPDFATYLGVQDTNTRVVNSYNNIIGDFIQDVSDNADMSGFAIFPTDSLRNAPQQFTHS